MDHELVDLPGAMALFKISRNTLFTRLREGRFPKPLPRPHGTAKLTWFRATLDDFAEWQECCRMLERIGLPREVLRKGVQDIDAAQRQRAGSGVAA